LPRRPALNRRAAQLRRLRDVHRDAIPSLLSEERREPDPLEDLPPRQREILQLIAEGRSRKEIAGILDVSVKTIETHRARLMQRLDIHDVAGLVRFAIRSGLVSPHD
jgi:DNA-binding NarL/FixJ family response regulator